MPQVSKKYLPHETLQKIFDLFFDMISCLIDKKEAEAVLAEFLTQTEKIMITKRVACFYLISKEISAMQIAESINISISTVTHLSYVYENSPKIKEFLSHKIKEEKVKHFFEDILFEFLYGMPRKGSNWSKNRKIYRQHQIDRQKPI